MMDHKFYQFWSDVVAQAVSGQIRPNEFTDWMRLGGDCPEQLMAMFKKYYGLEHHSTDNPLDSELYKSAMANFKKSMTDFYSMLDVVPKKDYLELEKKYLALQRKTEDLEAVILQLKLLFKTHPPNVEEGIAPLNQMLKTQNEHFLKMMDSLAGFYGISAEKKDEPEEK
ncbi:MAG: hypothetical protein C4518_12800 [Desulfobacteraceae bacterium]|nr:MAG: hypothetical protein C4518_12800 [Desulfobacteraceae bacterium]